IVHRDLKPANVMVLSRAGRLLPKLLDLGIAKGSAEPGTGMVAAAPRMPSGTPPPEPPDGWALTRDGAVMGSPLYMAPEQWVDAPAAGRASDLYALAVLTYEALSGRPPFTGRTIDEIARAHAHGSPPRLDEPVPQAVNDELVRALAKRPADRHASVTEF